MRSRAMKLAVFVAALCSFAGIAAGVTLTVERGSDLQSVFDYAADGDTVLLGTKTFETRRTVFQDSLCGNCEDPATFSTASYGYIVRNKGLVIVGTHRDSTILVTNAGYGVFLLNADGTELHNLTITGGRRDDDGNATDAGVVVRRSRVLINNVAVIDNDHRSPDSSVVVGIAGIVGREGAEITATDCIIRNCGWDGIALYRGATAVVTDCEIRDGRGAGIGITWDATALVLRNSVTGYWKGIGAFGTAQVTARNNLVYDNLGWGIIATGQSQLEATNNLVYHNGNCGIAPWSSESRGRIINNIIIKNGWRDQWVCPCVGVWNYGDWAKWTFRFNVVWGNKAAQYEGIWDQSGINGNLQVDPLVSEDGTFKIADESPIWHLGDSTIFNVDGTRSHIGHVGGSSAAR